MKREQLAVNREQLAVNSEQLTVNSELRTVNRRFLIALLIVICYLLFSCVFPQSDEPDQTRSPFDPDLKSWKTASWTPFSSSDSITGFAYGNPGGRDRYVAVAATGVIGWSDNGDIWNKAEKTPDVPPDENLPFNASFNAVTWGGGRFVAVANEGKIAWSTDGIHWTAEGHADGIDGFGKTDILGITWGNGMFVAVGGRGNFSVVPPILSNANISYSTDGISWTGCNDLNFGSSQLNDIAFDSGVGRFYIVGDEGKRGWFANPEENWNFIQLPSADEAPFGHRNLRKVTVGRCGSGIGIGVVFEEWGGKRILIAKNADFGDLDAGIEPVNFGSNTINGIAWGGDYFVAAGTGAMIGWWNSADPDNNSQKYWRALSFTEFQWWEITSLKAMKDRFFVGSIGGKIGYSR